MGWKPIRENPIAFRSRGLLHVRKPAIYGRIYGRRSFEIELSVGRGSRIRTCGPLLPKQVLYQAELCPDINM